MVMDVFVIAKAIAGGVLLPEVLHGPGLQAGAVCLRRGGFSLLPRGRDDDLGSQGGGGKVPRDGETFISFIRRKNLPYFTSFECSVIIFFIIIRTGYRYLL